jgi:hypothetical protein
VVEVADERAAHMLSTCSWIVFGDRSEAARCSRKGRSKARSCSPGSRSFSSPIQERGQPFKFRQIVFQVMTWPRGAAVYFGSSRLHRLPLHAAAHHNSKSLPQLFRVIRGWRFTTCNGFRRYQYQACTSPTETDVPCAIVCIKAR